MKVRYQRSLLRRTALVGIFPGGSVSKGSACNAGDLGLIPGSGYSPGGGNDDPSPVFLPGKCHGQRSLVTYSPWGVVRV